LDVTNEIMSPLNKKLIVLLLCFVGIATVLQAQGLKAPNKAPSSGMRAIDTTVLPVASVRSSDFIAAIVNLEPITNSEVNQRARELKTRMQGPESNMPQSQLLRIALDQLIDEKAQLDLARMNGVQASDEDVAQGINNVSQQSGLDEDRLKSQIQRDGLSWEAFKTQIRNQITLQKLREREVTNRIRPTDNEIQAFIRENEKKGVQQNIRLAHILVVVPETANEGQINTLKTKAENAIARVRTGEEFAKVAQEVSEATDARQGGDLGLRSSDRYPEIFANAVSQIKLGEVVGPLRSGAGWHILKLIDRQSGNDQDKLTTQTRARHILLKIKSNTNANTFRAQLSQIKQQIDRGAENFADMAKKYSEDGSADKGGDLGWATPGMFVPEFEEVMNRLAPGQISEPLTSRFGVHLIQVMERRQVPLSAREIQERARAALRESKLETAFEDWARGVRGRAYVEYREEPQ